MVLKKTFQKGFKRDDSTIQTIKQSKALKFLQLVCFSVILILTLPVAGINPAPGLDNSWIVALNLAFSRGMQLGKDIVFTFGPLGFLFLPGFCNVNHWIIAYFCCLSVHFVLVLLVFLLLSKIAGSKLSFLLGSASLFFIMPFLALDYKLILIAFLLLNIVLTSQVNSRQAWSLVLITSLCMAFASSIKFSAIISSVAIIIPSALIFMYRQQFINLVIFILSYLLAYMGIWILAGQRVANLIPYFRNSLELSAGYNQAMSLEGEGLQLTAGVAGICFFYLLFVYGMITKKWRMLVLLSPFLGFVFITFKHGFVRQDAHISLWFSTILFLFGWIYLACKQELPKLWRGLFLILYCITAFFVVTQPSDIISQNVSQRLYSNRVALKILDSSSAYRQELLAECKKQLQSEFQLDSSIVDYIGKNRIDIIPWEINLLFAYDMNWSPRPVFQSYSAYTQTLDLLNAACYEKNAPDMLFYEIGAIDGRYAVFDEPATFREILIHYEPLPGGVLLKKKEQPAAFQNHTVSTIESRIGQAIEIPKTKGFLFAKVSMEYSLLGKAATIAYKGDRMEVQLATDQGIFVYRFIPSTAKNGLFLSSHISTNQDLLNVLTGKFDKTIHALRFTTTKPWFYKDNIKVEFFEMQPDIK
jgi:hypothetical protein